ncbi:Maf family nucleotide pyrophosphatase [Alteromonas sp. ASW11-19]|uniref:7-methyl-GTP pyrophosphatase n=1 Tax=Alteromonas salexigens TaxID=2982530 RepID=A0ABT2VKY0_9ALTE|nr:nucleoside triphosphate pyrophosphatase [Alteromonas salexigens]MCU7553956.1 Maf family nucleotide pyrophosphatase [Alteromonas salexigens]
MHSLILASSSRYRQAQLANLGIHADTHAPNIDETPLDKETALELALRLAAEKAREVAPLYPDHLVIGADQVAVIEHEEGDQLLGKPGNMDNAVDQLRRCAGKQVVFYSAVSVCRHTTRQQITDHEVTRVHFRPLTDTEIRRYVETEKPFDCAGSFKCEGRGVLLFDAIDSRDPNALIGLPVMLLRDIVSQFDTDLLAMATAQ